MGKVIRVIPEELDKAAQNLEGISQNYTGIYNKLFQEISYIRKGWDGKDVDAYTEQINGFCQELKAMADKVANAAEILRKQSQNYKNTVDSNISAVKKLTN